MENRSQEQATLVAAEQGLVTGSLPLKGSWFINDWDPEHPRYHHVAALFNVINPVTPDLLEKIIVALMKHHDMLRARISGEKGAWQLFISESEDAPIHWIDLSRVVMSEHATIVEKAAYDLHRSLDPFAGSLLRIAYFARGGAQPDQLLFILHHSIADGYSLAILYSDLEMIYQQVWQGKEIALPPKTVSFKSWSTYLDNYVQGHLLQDYSWLDYYRSLPWQKLVPLPADYPDPNIQTIVPATRWVSTLLDRQEIRALLKWLPSLQLQLVEVLLAALVRAYAKWTGMPVLFLMLTDHGRLAFPTLKVLRTVGDFARIRWIFLDLSECQSLQEMLLETKRQMNALPNRGLDLDFAFHCEDAEVTKQVAHIRMQHQIHFNFISSLPSYLQKAGTTEDSRGLQLANSNIGPPELENSYPQKRFPLFCHGNILPEGFRVSWKYDESVYQQTTVEKLALYYIESLQEFARGYSR